MYIRWKISHKISWNVLVYMSGQKLIKHLKTNRKKSKILGSLSKIRNSYSPGNRPCVNLSYRHLFSCRSREKRLVLCLCEEEESQKHAREPGHTKSAEKILWTCGRPEYSGPRDNECGSFTRVNGSLPFLRIRARCTLLRCILSLSLPLCLLSSLLLVPLPESQSVYPSVFTHNKPLDNLCIPNGRDIIYLALP